MLQNVPYYQAIFFCNQIFTSLPNSFINFGLKQTPIYIINDINNYELIDEIKEVIITYCIKLCDQLNEQNSRLSSQRNKLTVEKVTEYIRLNYSNPGLSLESIFETIDLSPGYLGKLFKTETGISFNGYLNGVRLDIAKDLLATTLEPVSKICEKVGIYNITYFSTLFKKTFAMTPSKFREKVINLR
jgi:YesN/AraC family two-component response regulator